MSRPCGDGRAPGSGSICETLNHQGHEVSRRLLSQAFPSCTFVALVVQVLWLHHEDPRPSPAIYAFFRTFGAGPSSPFGPFKNAAQRNSCTGFSPPGLLDRHFRHRLHDPLKILLPHRRDFRIRSRIHKVNRIGHAASTQTPPCSGHSQRAAQRQSIFLDPLLQLRSGCGFPFT